MRSLLWVSAILLTTSACSIAPSKTASENMGNALEALEGPKVGTMSEQLEGSAKDAMASGDYKSAIQYYKQLYDLPKLDDDTKTKYGLELAKAMRVAGGNADTVRLTDLMLKQHPDNADLMEEKGLAQLADGKSQDAGRTLEQVMKLDPKRWRTLNALGILFMTKNMIPEAMAYFNEAIKYSNDNTSVLNNIGLSYAVDHKYDKAIDSLQEASRNASDPNRKRQVDLNTAMVLGISGDIDTARDVAGKYLKGPALDNNLGLYAHLANNDELARAYLNTALSNSSTHYERAWDNLEMVTQQSKGSAGGKVVDVGVQADKNAKKTASKLNAKPAEGPKVTVDKSIQATDVPGSNDNGDGDGSGNDNGDNN